MFTRVSFKHVMLDYDIILALNVCLRVVREGLIIVTGLTFCNIYYLKSLEDKPVVHHPIEDEVR